MKKQGMIFFGVICTALCWVQPVCAREPADSLISLELSDGSVLKGTVVVENPDSLTFVTSSGLKITLPKSIINSRRIAHGRIVAGKFQRSDPNYTRLLFTPTGRPLRKGEGYFTDYYVFFPGVAYGLTNHLSIMAGISLIPAIRFKEQMFYIAPRYGVELEERFSLSGGLLYMNAGGDFAAGISFITGTYGLPDKCITAGLGLGFSTDEGDIEFARYPILVWGGNLRLTNSLALVSENWLITGQDFQISAQPFSLAARFFGEHIAVDLGMILVPEILDKGFPIPWLSFIYNFGG